MPGSSIFSMMASSSSCGSWGSFEIDGAGGMSARTLTQRTRGGARYNGRKSSHRFREVRLSIPVMVGTKRVGRSASEEEASKESSYGSVRFARSTDPDG